MKRVYLFILVVHIVSCNEREKPISFEENIKIDSVNILLEVVDSQKTSNNLPEISTDTLNIADTTSASTLDTTKTIEKIDLKNSNKKPELYFNIKAGDTISSPFNIKMNTNGVDGWFVSEGEGGYVSIYDEQNQFLTSGILFAEGKWFGLDSVMLSTKLTFSTLAKKGKLIISNNPGEGSEEEEGVKKEIEIPIYF
jgi:hypothetical protein